jgi:hypothetical protein
MDWLKFFVMSQRRSKKPSPGILLGVCSRVKPCKEFPEFGSAGWNAMRETWKKSVRDSVGFHFLRFKLCALTREWA